MNSQEYIKFIEKYKNSFAASLHQSVKELLPDYLVLPGQIIAKSVVIIMIYLLLDFLLRRSLLALLVKYTKKNKDKNHWLHIVIKRKVVNSILHVLPAIFANIVVPYLFYHHPMSFQVTHRFFLIFLIILLTQLWHRFMMCVEDLATDNNNYTSVAVTSFGQLLRIVGFTILFFVGLSILFDFKSSQIVSVIGAITAVILLVFRDPILGFVAGIHASSTQMVKKGDWVYLAKYNLEGYVKEISLLTLKIEGFDKTYSTIPTYDLITSEVRNNESIIKNKKRLIKRSIFLNINSFKFLNEQDLDHYLSYQLIRDYIMRKRNDFEQIRLQNQKEYKEYEMKLTNVGLFRMYIYYFLISNPNVVKNDLLMVRQREISTHGLPIEIFCFANTGVWEEYEIIQSDIFDFILTSAKEFELEVVQTGFK